MGVRVHGEGHKFLMGTSVGKRSSASVCLSVDLYIYVYMCSSVSALLSLVNNNNNNNLICIAPECHRLQRRWRTESAKKN